MVAREGSAPPTSGCRPDVILFHHRALQREWFIGLMDCWILGDAARSVFRLWTLDFGLWTAKSGCRGWIRTTIVAFKGRCPTVRRPGKPTKWINGFVVEWMNGGSGLRVAAHASIQKSINPKIHFEKWWSRR